MWEPDEAKDFAEKKMAAAFATTDLNSLSAPLRAVVDTERKLDQHLADVAERELREAEEEAERQRALVIEEQRKTQERSERRQARAAARSRVMAAQRLEVHHLDALKNRAKLRADWWNEAETKAKLVLLAKAQKDPEILVGWQIDIFRNNCREASQHEDEHGSTGQATIVSVVKAKKRDFLGKTRHGLMFNTGEIEVAILNIKTAVAGPLSAAKFRKGENDAKTPAGENKSPTGRKVFGGNNSIVGNADFGVLAPSEDFLSQTYLQFASGTAYMDWIEEHLAQKPTDTKSKRESEHNWV